MGVGPSPALILFSTVHKNGLIMIDEKEKLEKLV